jgi:hypothetical protein
VGVEQGVVEVEQQVGVAHEKVSVPAQPRSPYGLLSTTM